MALTQKLDEKKLDHLLSSFVPCFLSLALLHLLPLHRKHRFVMKKEKEEKSMIKFCVISQNKSKAIC